MSRVYADPGGARTPDLPLRSRLLFLLSYGIRVTEGNRTPVARATVGRSATELRSPCGVDGARTRSFSGSIAPPRRSSVELPSLTVSTGIEPAHSRSTGGPPPGGVRDLGGARPSPGSPGRYPGELHVRIGATACARRCFDVGSNHNLPVFTQALYHRAIEALAGRERIELSDGSIWSRSR